MISDLKSQIWDFSSNFEKVCVVMRQSLASLLLLLVLVSTAASQAKQTSWLRGAWEGTGYQTDDGSTWPMKLTITRSKGRGRTFSIDYRSLNCGGRWKLLSLNQSKARFREQLRYGKDKCANNGLVVVERISGRQIVFLFSYENSREITASAVLKRKL